LRRHRYELGVKPALSALASNFSRIKTMTVAEKLLADVIIIGMFCGLYLQYKGFKAMNAVPATAGRRNRALTHDEALKLVEAIGYAFLGALFEMASITQAVFA
jgi:hypothetical protein